MDKVIVIAPNSRYAIHEALDSYKLGEHDIVVVTDLNHLRGYKGRNYILAGPYQQMDEYDAIVEYLDTHEMTTYGG